MTINRYAAIATAVFATAAAAQASAATFSFTGSLAKDNDKAAYVFTVAAPTTVTLTSLGYAGGINGAGATIARGGFDPVLSLYDATGTAVDFNDDGLGAPIDTVTGVGADSILSLSLAAGTYKVYLTQYNNFGPITLPASFAFDGQPNFRGGFVDFYGNQRSGNWALDISGVNGAIAGSVPETASWVMTILGLGMVGAVARRRNAAVAA